jgi:hypothetical protein
MDMLLNKGYDYSVSKIRSVVKDMKKNEYKITELRFEVLAGLKILAKDKIKAYEERRSRLNEIQRHIHGQY